MMPLNVRERRFAFFAFLGFLVVTVTVIVLTFFYGMQLPTRQNDLMQREIDKLQKDQAFADKFGARLNQTKTILDKINIQGSGSPEQMSAFVKLNVDSMNMQIGLDTTSRLTLYRNITAVLASLNEVKEELRNKNSGDVENQKLRQELMDLQTRYQNLDRDYALLKQNKTN